MIDKTLYENYIAHNFSYKIVAFFVSLVLWVTLLGRSDLILNHTMELQLLTRQNYVVVNKIPRYIKVKLSGPGTGLKKFKNSEQTFTLNLEKLEPGIRFVKIDKNSINVPVGVKVLSLKPSKIKVQIKELKE